MDSIWKALPSSAVHSRMDDRPIPAEQLIGKSTPFNTHSDSGKEGDFENRLNELRTDEHLPIR
jgi:hypothetical protein